MEHTIFVAIGVARNFLNLEVLAPTSPPQSFLQNAHRTVANVTIAGSVPTDRAFVNCVDEMVISLGYVSLLITELGESFSHGLETDLQLSMEGYHLKGKLTCPHHRSKFTEPLGKRSSSGP